MIVPIVLFNVGGGGGGERLNFGGVGVLGGGGGEIFPDWGRLLDF